MAMQKKWTQFVTALPDNTGEYWVRVMSGEGVPFRAYIDLSAGTVENLATSVVYPFWVCTAWRIL